MPTMINGYDIDDDLRERRPRLFLPILHAQRAPEPRVERRRNHAGTPGIHYHERRCASSSSKTTP